MGGQINGFSQKHTSECNLHKTQTARLLTWKKKDNHTNDCCQNVTDPIDYFLLMLDQVIDGWSQPQRNTGGFPSSEASACRIHGTMEKSHDLFIVETVIV